MIFYKHIEKVCRRCHPWKTVATMHTTIAMIIKSSQTNSPKMSVLLISVQQWYQTHEVAERFSADDGERWTPQQLMK